MSQFFIIFAILPERTVVNETAFFTFLSILIGLVIIAFFLRRRNSLKDTDDNSSGK
ncbi:MAG TPA: hypothetical protein VFP49_00575 [Nitrososphaeraceae archaeon]|jgi:hypothetical protein|nr:hypothetical protein [Nitrososphaeraceae archaeon]